MSCVAYILHAAYSGIHIMCSIRITYVAKPKYVQGRKVFGLHAEYKHELRVAMFLHTRNDNYEYKHELRVDVPSYT